MADSQHVKFPPIKFLDDMAMSLLATAEAVTDIRRKVALQTAATQLSLSYSLLLLERHMAEREGEYTPPDPENGKEWHELIFVRGGILAEMQVYYKDGKAPPERLVGELLEVQMKIDQLDPEAFYGK